MIIKKPQTFDYPCIATIVDNKDNIHYNIRLDKWGDLLVYCRANKIREIIFTEATPVTEGTYEKN